MKIVKMSLANMQGKMSRMEMKGIMAGSGGATCGSICTGPFDCPSGDCCADCGTSGPSLKKCQKC